MPSGVRRTHNFDFDVCDCTEIWTGAGYHNDAGRVQLKLGWHNVSITLTLHSKDAQTVVEGLSKRIEESKLSLN
jgi:hypothetical protein